MSKRIDGFLVFPQRIENTAAVSIVIGALIVSGCCVRRLLSYRRVKDMKKGFTRESRVHVDLKNGVASISRIVPSGRVLEEVQRFIDELKEVGICVIQKPLPRQKDVDIVLAA